MNSNFHREDFWKSVEIEKSKTWDGGIFIINRIFFSEYWTTPTKNVCDIILIRPDENLAKPVFWLNL